MQFELDIPQRVIIGVDTHTKVAQEARSLRWSRVMIVSDPFVKTTGRVNEISGLLSKADLAVAVYTDVTGEPDTNMVVNVLERFKAEKCDGIIALGGGSVIDTAKTISVLAENEGTVQGVMGVDNVARPGAGVIVLPTTSGTGSEATKVVVIADSQSQVKMTGRSRFYVPDVAILAPVAKAGMLFNANRLFDNFNLLDNLAGVFDLFKFAAAIRACVKSMGLKIINFFSCKRRSFVLGMSRLTTDVTGTVAFFLSQRFDDIRRWRLGGVGRILREFSNLVSQFRVFLDKCFIDFNQFSNLFFKFGNARIQNCSVLEVKFRPQISQQDYYRTNFGFCLRKLLICRRECVTIR